MVYSLYSFGCVVIDVIKVESEGVQLIRSLNMHFNRFNNFFVVPEVDDAGKRLEA